jgi:hypothetical protein
MLERAGNLFWHVSVVRDIETVVGLNYWRFWLIRVSV